MTRVQRRCRHCQAVYTYQPSGYGSDSATNNDRHCPDCMAVILAALADVPRRVERVQVPETGVTAFELEALEQARAEAAKAAGQLPIRRIACPLFDLSDPSNQERAGITRKDGRTYHWRYWTRDPEGTAEVHVEMERDIATGETRPWRYLTGD